MDIGAIGMLAIVTAYMTLIALLLNKRFEDLRVDLSGVQSDMKSFRKNQDRLITALEWLMTKADAKPDEAVSLYQDPQADDD